jgi:hypothetical protein
MDSMGMAAMLVAGLLGAAAGSGLTWRVVGARATARHARLVAAAREQVAASTKNLRTVNLRLQTELEKEKATARQRQAGFAAEQRASVSRLEGQLRFAYAEIDRLNASSNAGAGSRGGFHALLDSDRVDEHGFALTRPFQR